MIAVSSHQHHKILFICSAKRIVRKKAEDEPTAEICGYTLREHPAHESRLSVCDFYDAEWDKDIVERDGNYFAVSSLHWILTNTLQGYGDRISPTSCANADCNILADVKDGERWISMAMQPSDLGISVHADGAAITKSTQRQMYLMFIHLLNLPVGVRQNVWPLFAVWGDDALPRDREPFIMKLSLQLKQIQEGSPVIRPVIWEDKDNLTIHSSLYVHSILSDTLERYALNGQMSHSAAQDAFTVHRSRRRPFLEQYRIWSIKPINSEMTRTRLVRLVCRYDRHITCHTIFFVQNNIAKMVAM